MSTSFGSHGNSTLLRRMRHRQLLPSPPMAVLQMRLPPKHLHRRGPLNRLDALNHERPNRFPWWLAVSSTPQPDITGSSPSTQKRGTKSGSTRASTHRPYAVSPIGRVPKDWRRRLSLEPSMAG